MDWRRGWYSKTWARIVPNRLARGTRSSNKIIKRHPISDAVVDANREHHPRSGSLYNKVVPDGHRVRSALDPRRPERVRWLPASLMRNKAWLNSFSSLTRQQTNLNLTILQRLTVFPVHTEFGSWLNRVYRGSPSGFFLLSLNRTALHLSSLALVSRMVGSHDGSMTEAVAARVYAPNAEKRQP
jgi:hypothetical protein